MNLFINYYNAGNRQYEIDYCLEKNLANPLIDLVVIFNQFKEIDHPKAINKMVKNRPTYQDFFNATTKCPNSINIIANSDIFFDETLENANRLSPKQCYALTRWEFNGTESRPFEKAHLVRNSFCPAHSSQDVWIFRGGSKMTGCDIVEAQRQKPRVYDKIKFTMGIPGCDNVLAARLKSVYGVNNVKNPANDIRCHHYHVNSIPRPYTHIVTGGRRSMGIVKQGRLPISSL